MMIYLMVDVAPTTLVDLSGVALVVVFMDEVAEDVEVASSGKSGSQVFYHVCEKPGHVALNFYHMFDSSITSEQNHSYTSSPQAFYALHFPLFLMIHGIWIVEPIIM